MSKIDSMLGEKFGRLTVLRRHRAKKDYVLCKCDCGTKKSINAYSVRDGKTQSCGCLFSELMKLRFRKHGETAGGAFSREYRAYYGMMTRCYNSKIRQYKDYGGRGVFVSEEWKNSFPKFLEQMGRCPPGYSLDRRDVNGPYSADNCRWADRFTQANNARSNIPLTYQGKTQNLASWSRERGIPEHTMKCRLNVGKSIDEIMFQGKLRHATTHLLTFNGKAQTITQWCNELGIKHTGTVRHRIRRGLSIDKILAVPQP